ncbi:MAG: hypothetical protein Tsb0020_43580 [Haliangiales bacterium]
MPLRESKIAPVFFIGLGGCGGAIVDELARKVKQEESFQRYSDLIQFFALDTDVDDLAHLHWIDSAHKFALSDFDKPEYVELKRGALHAREDPLFTHWWPAWYRPRSTRGKGAGQIRIESRMALYYQLENDRGKIIETLQRAVRRAYDVHNPYRANKAANIYIYASLAGGTGSGGFATMAQTIRRLLGGQRGHQTIGTFVMPNVFRAKGLPPNQFDKVMANGYSALQELELLQSASPDMPIEFHYNPDDPAHVSMSRPAFDQVYLVEEKTARGVVIADSAQIYHAIADAAHAQIFSPILDKQGSTLDNDTRELMQLDEQAFTKSFGSFGISALVLPVDDILEYCALRLGRALLLDAVPGGVAALGDGATTDDADRAFANGVADRAESSSEDASMFRQMRDWVDGSDGEGGGESSGEGVLSGFLRRCQEDVARDVDKGIKLRAWDESELASFEDDPERVQSEVGSAWTQLARQLARSDEEANRRAQRAAMEVVAGDSPLSLAEMIRGRGPTESRYLYIRLRDAILEQQEAARKLYDRSLSLDDQGLQDEFRRQVEVLKQAAPRTFLERLPTRENDYFEVSAAFASWYRDTINKLRHRVRAHALLEFYSVILAELDRRREASLHFFARIDRINHIFEERAERLLSHGRSRREGGHANQFVLDVEVLQDHRTGQRLWPHLYADIVTSSDLELSDALTKLADIAAAGGTEQDIQRRIVDNLLETTSRALRPRVCGARDQHGLRIDDQLRREAELAVAARRLAQDAHGGPLPAPGDERWREEIKQVDQEAVEVYIRDKLDFAASKCQPFITLAAGGPYLPEKAYCVLDARYRDALGEQLTRLSALSLDGGQIITGEDPHKIIFYVAQLGCALHVIKSLPEYERRYLAVKQMELDEGKRVPGLPSDVPQIPIHQDMRWEGAPDRESRLFRISIDGVKADDAKLNWIQRVDARQAQAQDVASARDDLLDFTMGIAFGLIATHDDDHDGPGFYLEDDSLVPDARRLGKFRDQAFAAYRDRNQAQRSWLGEAWTRALKALEEDRAHARIAELFDTHLRALEDALKNADHLGGAMLAEHLGREKSAVLAFRADKAL